MWKKKNEDELYRAYKESKGKDRFQIKRLEKVEYTSKQEINPKDKQVSDKQAIKEKGEFYLKKAETFLNKAANKLDLSEKETPKNETHVPYHASGQKQSMDTSQSIQARARIFMGIGLIILVFIVMFAILYSNEQEERYQEDDYVDDIYDDVEYGDVFHYNSYEVKDSNGNILLTIAGEEGSEIQYTVNNYGETSVYVNQENFTQLVNAANANQGTPLLLYNVDTQEEIPLLFVFFESDEDGDIVTKSLHPSLSEEEAMNLAYDMDATYDASLFAEGRYTFYVSNTSYYYSIFALKAA